MSNNTTRCHFATNQPCTACCMYHVNDECTRPPDTAAPPPASPEPAPLATKEEARQHLRYARRYTADLIKELRILGYDYAADDADEAANALRSTANWLGEPNGRNPT